MFSVLLVYLVTLRWRKLRRVVSCFPAIERSKSYLELDYEKVWSRSLREVRRELALPEEGFMHIDNLGALLADG